MLSFIQLEVDAKSYEKVSGTSNKLTLKPHGQLARDSDCILHSTPSGDRIKLVKAGFDSKIKRFTYLAFETEKNTRIPFGKPTETTVVTTINFKEQ